MDFLSDDEADEPQNHQKNLFPPRTPVMRPKQPQISQNVQFQNHRYAENAVYGRQREQQVVNSPKQYQNRPLQPHILPAPTNTMNYGNNNMMYNSPIQVQVPKPIIQTKEQLWKKALSKALQSLERLPDEKKNFSAQTLKDFMKQAEKVLPPSIFAKIQKYANKEYYLKYHKQTNPRQKRIILASIYLLIGEEYYLKCLERSFISSKHVLRLCLEALKAKGSNELFRRTTVAIKSFRVSNKNLTDLLNYVLKFIQTTDIAVFNRVIETLRTTSTSTRPTNTVPVATTRPAQSYNNMTGPNHSLKRTFTDVSTTQSPEKRRSPIPKIPFSYNLDFVGNCFEKNIEETKKIQREQPNKRQRVDQLLPLNFVEGLIKQTITQNTSEQGNITTNNTAELAKTSMKYFNHLMKATLTGITKEFGKSKVGVDAILYHNALLESKNIKSKIEIFKKTEGLKRTYQQHMKNVDFLNDAKYEEINKIMTRRSDLPDAFSRQRLKIKRDILKTEKKAPGMIERQVDAGVRQVIQEFITNSNSNNTQTTVKPPQMKPSITAKDLKKFLALSNNDESNDIRRTWETLLSDDNED